MGDCTNELQLKHAELLGKLQNEIEGMRATLLDFSAIKDTLIELRILNTQEIEFNKRQTISNEKFEDTLTRIDKNLTSLDDRVGSLEQTKKEVKTDTIARYQSKFIFFGVFIASILSLVGIILTIIYK